MSAPLLIDDVTPLSLVRPADAGELGDVIRRAAADGHGLFPVGGRTQLHLGLPPSKPAIAVDMTAFDRVIDYPARDMTITVQAGVTLRKLKATLAAENQRLPINAPAGATIGGVIATNASGPLRHGYGTLRDYVIGISFMTDDGQEVKAGGRVVKNVAGYDLCKLQIGALGTLGIVTQVTLKVLPQPEKTEMLSGECPGDRVAEVLERLHQTATRPALVLLMGSNWLDDTTVRFDIGYQGNAEAIAWQSEQIQKELQPEFPVKYSEMNRDWTFFDFMCHEGGDYASFKVNLLPSRVPDFLNRVAEFRHFTWWAFGGIVKLILINELPLDQAAPIVTALRQAAVAAQGNLVITRCPPAWKRELPVWGEPRGDRGLMRAVKGELDPRDLFNPGRFLV
jgi:glycolate oxidase FAD binding subunit